MRVVDPRATKFSESIEGEWESLYAVFPEGACVVEVESSADEPQPPRAATAMDDAVSVSELATE